MILLQLMTFCFPEYPAAYATSGCIAHPVRALVAISVRICEVIGTLTLKSTWNKFRSDFAASPFSTVCVRPVLYKYQSV